MDVGGMTVDQAAAALEGAIIIWTASIMRVLIFQLLMPEAAAPDDVTNNSGFTIDN